MKHSVIIAFLFLSGSTSLAQPGREVKTIFAQPMQAKPAAGLGVQITPIDRSSAVLLSPSAGLLINNSVFVGGEYSAIVNRYFVPESSYKPVKDEASYWKIRYGGPKMSFTFNPTDAINFEIGALAGWGTVGREFQCNSLTESSPQHALFDKRLNNEGHFFVVEPSANFALNVTQNVKFRVGASYRSVSGVSKRNTIGMSDRLFSAPSLTLSVQIAMSREL